jgi:hypothetical protein
VIPTTRLFLIPLLALAGCSTMNTDRAALHIGIVDISIADAAAGASEAVFTLKISNQEIFTTVVERDNHRIFVDGTPIGNASGTEVYPLTQLGVTTRVVKVQVADAAGMQALRAAVQRGGGEYKIDSRMWTNSGGDKVTVVNTSSGSFKIAGR